MITAIAGPKPQGRSRGAGTPRFDSPELAAYHEGMCLICVDFDRGALRPMEARRALREMREKLSADHIREIERKLADAESDPQPPAAGSKP